MRLFKLVTACLLLTLLMPSAKAECGQPEGRPSIGLVLSGGGARGAAHVGVIRVLEELNVPIDCIAGTSMGAIVGGLYASGLDATELEQILEGLDWVDALQDSPSRKTRSFRRKQDDVGFLIDFDLGFRDGKVRLPKGLVQGQKLNQLLRRMTMPVQGVTQFDELPIPFRAIATNVENGNMVVLGRGDLVSALKASMSAPGVFAPVEIGKQLLIDGGVANNLPVDVARAMGADVMIVVDIGFPLLEREQLDSAIALTNQMLTILIRRKATEQLNSLTARDIAILPDLGDIGSTDFHRSADAAPLGEAAAREQHQALIKLSVSDTEFKHYQTTKLERRDFRPRKLREVRINDKSQWSDRVLEGNLHTAPGDLLNVDEVQADVSRLYGLDTFELVDYKVSLVDDEFVDLDINTISKSWGPNFLNFGVNLQDDLDGFSGYNFAMRYTKTQVNPLGAEWRTDFSVGDTAALRTEFYQPLNYASRYFIAPQILLQRNNVFDYSLEGDVLSTFRLNLALAQLDIGRTLGQNGEFRMGINRATGRLSLRVGDPTQERTNFDSGAFLIGYTYDSRDDVRFARDGLFGQLQFTGFREGLGDNTDNDRVELNWLHARSRGENTLLLFGNLGSNLDGNGAIEEQFRIGGPFNLSGYQIEELAGQHSALIAAGYYRRIALGSSTFQTPLYLGATLETGNVWQDSDDISFDNTRIAGSVFVGLDTFVGPIYLVYGIAENGRTATYFRLGQLFSNN